MGRGRGLAKISFEELQTDYDENFYEDEWVDCLNALPATDRNLMIQFIEHGCFYSKLARKHNISTPLLKSRIEEIRQKIKEIYERRYR